ncbi:MAG: alpha/beta hydrolase [Cellvibrionaceae bacterium]|nr:alpha/beta hydrolase [Cellvibrionaceae bacterium]
METFTYSKLDDKELQLDVFKSSRPNGTAILLIHGGGLIVGARQMVHAYAEPLTAQGFTVIVPSYRLRTEVLWPEPLNDIKSAIHWVVENAEQLGIQADKIVLEGFSAGAMLAFLAAKEQGVAAVVSFFSWAEMPRDPNNPFFLGEHLSATQLDAADPINAIDAEFPPTMLLHGMTDALISSEQALSLFTKLKDAGCTVDLRLYHNHVHDFSSEPSMLEPIQADVALFLQRSVVDPEKYVQESLENNMFLQPGPPPTMPEVVKA